MLARPELIVTTDDSPQSTGHHQGYVTLLPYRRVVNEDLLESSIGRLVKNGASDPQRGENSNTGQVARSVLGAGDIVACVSTSRKSLKNHDG